MTSKLICVLAFALGAGTLDAQDVSGDWLGTLQAGPAELRLALHISKTTEGTLTATLDSIDQGAKGIPFNSATLVRGKLSLTSIDMHATYEGTVNPDGSVLTGTWTQGAPLPLEFKRGIVKTDHAPAKPSDIDGAWLGTLDTGATKLRIVFHILMTADGLTATADSPDQGAKGIPVTTVTRDGSTITFELKALGASFKGTIAPDLTSIDGTFSQGGGSLPLLLKRLKDTAERERRRPQNPVKPYPYREEEVVYNNKAAGIRLSGTLTVPQGKGPFAGVVLVTGSGPQDRDETIMEHRPFLVLADYLTRRGIIVLRADDRGVGKSGGDFAASTTTDFATDVEAGLAYLKTRPEADPKKLGLIGHSEGGAIAPMIAARNADVAFIVIMAGPGVRGDEILVAQVAAIVESSGKSPEEAKTAAVQEREILQRVESGVPDTDLPDAAQPLRSPWFQQFLTYDPATALRKVKCPVLALNGEKDTQVPADQNLPAIRKALEEGGNSHFEALRMPGLNHLFQTALTGSPTEYGDIEETMAPAVLQKIGDWILKTEGLV